VPGLCDLNTHDVAKETSGGPVEVEYFDQAKDLTKWLRCSFCSESADKIILCSSCGASICQQTGHGTAGCIVFGTLQINLEIKCPTCAARSGESISYRVSGYGRQRATPVNWPLLLVRLHLLGLHTHAQDVLGKVMENLYLKSKEVRLCCRGLCMANLSARKHLLSELVAMSITREKTATARHEAWLAFIDRTRKEGHPPNMVLVIDTHAICWSGLLQSTGGTGSTLKSVDLDDLLTIYVGKGVMDAMKGSAEHARCDPRVERINGRNGVVSSLLPKARGGLRVVILISCGPAVQSNDQFEGISRLVAK
jgi:hypothetical protein